MFPEKLDKLILVDSAAKFLSLDMKDGITKSQVEKISLLLEQDFIRALLAFARTLFTLEEKKADNFKNVWKDLTRKAVLPRKIALKEYLNIIEREDLREVLPSIKTQTLIISGEKDYICGKKKAKELRDNIPQAKLKFIKGCGHLPFLSKPDVFNKILEEFLIYGNYTRKK